jgi:hypothetical protein
MIAPTRTPVIRPRCPLPVAWLPWVAHRARDEGVTLGAARWDGARWQPCGVAELAAEASWARIEQWPGCGGLRTRVVLGVDDDAGWGAWVPIEPRPPSAEARWRRLLLEALVLHGRTGPGAV